MGAGIQVARLPIPGLISLALISLASISPSCSSYSGFLNKKSEKYCQVQAECNPEISCDLANSLDTGYTSSDEDCDFDARAARDCLRGEWTCSKEIPEFSYPIPPKVCASVCRSAVPE